MLLIFPSPGSPEAIVPRPFLKIVSIKNLAKSEIRLSTPCGSASQFSINKDNNSVTPDDSEISDSSNTGPCEIKLAVDNLFKSSNKTYENKKDIGGNTNPIKLRVCSSDIDIVMDKHGGICTKCNISFKSKLSLRNHLEKCRSADQTYVKDFINDLTNDLTNDY